MQTEREYLCSLTPPLAKPTKGRFSREALAALDAARAAGITFKDKVVPVKRTVEVKVKAVRAETPKVNAAAVREWARGEGITVGARGRVHPDVINAYVSAKNDSGEAVAAVENEFDPYRPSAARIRYHDIFKATDLDGRVIKRTYRDCCTNCGYSIGWCYCQGGPQTFSLVDTSARLTLEGTEGSAQRVLPWA